MFQNDCQQIIPDEYVCAPFKGSFPSECVSDCVSALKGRAVTILERICSVPTVVFGKRERDASVFLAQVFLILALKASTLSFPACNQQCYSGLVNTE